MEGDEFLVVTHKEASIITATAFCISTTMSVSVVRSVCLMTMPLIAIVSVLQTNSVLQSVSADIVTVLMAKCMTIGHAGDVTALQTEFDKK